MHKGNKYMPRKENSYIGRNIKEKSYIVILFSK